MSYESVRSKYQEERDALRARVAELEADCKAGLRIAYELTLETQTVEEACTDLVRQVRDARAQLAAAQAEVRALSSAEADFRQQVVEGHAREDALEAQLAAAQAKLDAPSPHCHETEWHERIAAHRAKLEADLAEAARHVENLLPYAKAFWRPGEQPSAVISEAAAWLKSRGAGR